MCRPISQMARGQNGMAHSRGRPYHPMTQGKIERWHRSMKTKFSWKTYFLPSELEARIADFVATTTQGDIMRAWTT